MEELGNQDQCKKVSPSCLSSWGESALREGRELFKKFVNTNFFQ